jgi:hypothetical protein
MAVKRGPKWVDVPLIEQPARVPEVVVLADRMPARDGLRRVSDELAAVERDRHALVARRDELVAQLRAEGLSWVAIAAAAGVSRQALMKR